MTRQAELEALLQDAFAPLFLKVENESHMHNVPPGSESHFKVQLVSAAFTGLRPVAQHQAVYRILAEQMQAIHALALHTWSPEQWQGQAAQTSPKCMGGGN